MITVRIKDNQLNISDDNLKDIHDLVEKRNNRTLEQLEADGVFVFPESIKDYDDLTKDQMILHLFP